MQQNLINNKITALYMGETDSRTGRWFPIKKMTWGEKTEQNYLDISIQFIQGAKIYQSLYPDQSNLFTPKDLNRIIKHKEISKSSWRRRMPVSRPLEKEHQIALGLNIGSHTDPVQFVARDGGYVNGDPFDIFPEVAPDERGNYNFIFRGIDTWKMVSNNRPELEAVTVGAKVTLQPPNTTEILPGEWTDEIPPDDIRMQMFVEGQLVGYAPNYIKELYKNFGPKLNVKVFQELVAGFLS